jgi:tRNA G10  N-methylase Trm11
MQNNSDAGQAVYDPFLGSGTTLIAAETIGRLSLAVELEPRWEAFTGKDAILLKEGRTFKTIASERLPPAQSDHNESTSRKRPK